ncbi:MAG: hypothetical protein K2L07_04670 [Lachnospiraceae bacterium]|nr:hypothetical protein [Lachnospiraceae bacterium]
MEKPELELKFEELSGKNKFCNHRQEYALYLEFYAVGTLFRKGSLFNVLRTD